MQHTRFLECLAEDASRLREVAAGDLGAPVPTCPDWTVADLVRHVGQVYLHKTECMRLNAFPRPWPPDLAAEEPLALLDRSYAALTGEFAARAPDSPSVTWFEPEQTVGFWARRMAQETVIHRLDAELALGASPAPIPADLAVDGVDEVLVRFLAYGSTEWREDFGELLDDCDGRAVGVRAGDSTWLVQLTKDGVKVSGPGDAGAGAAAVAATVSGPGDAVAGVTVSGPGDTDARVAATVSGAPDALLIWLWRRSGDEAITTHGDPAVIGKLWQLLGAATV
jgi:uncharacterized protein (TIGR03083 family)